eukprot:g29915.t1
METRKVLAVELLYQLDYIKKSNKLEKLEKLKKKFKKKIARPARPLRPVHFCLPASWLLVTFTPHGRQSQQLGTTSSAISTSSRMESLHETASSALPASCSSRILSSSAATTSSSTAPSSAATTVSRLAIHRS